MKFNNALSKIITTSGYIYSLAFSLLSLFYFLILDIKNLYLFVIAGLMIFTLHIYKKAKYKKEYPFKKGSFAPLPKFEKLIISSLYLSIAYSLSGYIIAIPNYAFRTFLISKFEDLFGFYFGLVLFLFILLLMAILLKRLLKQQHNIVYYSSFAFLTFILFKFLGPYYSENPQAVSRIGLYILGSIPLLMIDMLFFRWK